MSRGWNAPNYLEIDSDDDESSYTSSQSESLAVSPKSDFFTKKFLPEQLQLWVRVRTKDSVVSSSDLSCEVHGVDGFSICTGSIDIMQGEKGYSRRFCTWINARWAVDYYANSLLCNEFYHEALLSYAIRVYLADLPMFTRAALVSIDEQRRHLVFHTVQGENFDHVIHSLTFKQLKSVLFQTLIGIRLAQHRLNFKHHDLHLGNVMISKAPLSTQIFDTPEGLLSVVVEGVEATIIDFGLSSISKEHSVIRLDIDLLITGDSQTSSQQSVKTEDLGKSWGNWNPELKGDTGYDYAMFIESVTEQVILERPLPMDKLSLLSQLQFLIHTSFTSRCRPVTPFELDWAKVWKIFEA